MVSDILQEAPVPETPAQILSSLAGQFGGLSCNQQARFTLFKKLPIEIRLKIWEDAIPDPRVVDIHMTTLKPGVPRLIFKSTAIVPALLSVSREARKTILETYTLCFETKGSAKKIRLCPQDTALMLGMAAIDFVGRVGGRDLEPMRTAIAGIEVLAFPINSWHGFQPNKFYSSATHNFAALRNLILVGCKKCDHCDRVQRNLDKLGKDPQPLLRWKRLIRKAFKDRLLKDNDGVENDDQLPGVQWKSFSSFAADLTPRQHRCFEQFHLRPRILGRSHT